MSKDIWIAGIARGHNAGVCLLKNGEIVFSIEEERLTRQKYDGGPLASMIKILEYTDKLDFLVVAHTQSLKETAGKIDYTGDDIYTGLARKLNLIDRKKDLHNHPQVIDLSHMHHRLHAACAFYRSGFKEAAALIVDGAGTFIPLRLGYEETTAWETETIFDCSYPSKFKTMYKHLGLRGPNAGQHEKKYDASVLGEEGTFELLLTDRAGITKVYEAVTEYCGFSSIEAGKTMGLFPYGKENPNIPRLFDSNSSVPLSDRNLIVPNYPNGAIVNHLLFDELIDGDAEDVTTLENRRDLAYACQTQTQEQVLRLIKKASEMTGQKKVVITGGYGLNCVANYYYLEQLKDTDIEIYVEPISNDAGTAMGAAMMFYRDFVKDRDIYDFKHNLYLGPKYDYSAEQIDSVVNAFSAEIEDADYDKVVELLTNRNIVAMFQGG
jgi:carbamoyltransferase